MIINADGRKADLELATRYRYFLDLGSRETAEETNAINNFRQRYHPRYLVRTNKPDLILTSSLAVVLDRSIDHGIIVQSSQATVSFLHCSCSVDYCRREFKGRARSSRVVPLLFNTAPRVDCRETFRTRDRERPTSRRVRDAYTRNCCRGFVSSVLPPRGVYLNCCNAAETRPEAQRETRCADVRQR